MRLRAPTSSRRPPLTVRLVRVVALVAYLATATGLPLPHFVSAAAEADSTAPGIATPYPCMAHRCGCRSAQQCWNACCCMSDVEKLMWAERNGVTPPASLLLRTVSTPVVEAPAGRSCCTKSSAPSSSRSPKRSVVATSTKVTSPADPKSDCAKCESPAVATKDVVPAAAVASEIRWVSYLAAQRCSGGATTQWINGPTCLPIQTPLHYASIGVDGRESISAAERQLCSAFLPPLKRPPRIVWEAAGSASVT